VAKKAPRRVHARGDSVRQSETDETAWLEESSQLIQQGRHGELDFSKLGDYLAEQAQRDRREVRARLVLLLANLLAWNYRVRKQTTSWRKEILAERQELAESLGRGVLRRHAKSVLTGAYADALGLAAAEAGLPAAKFPQKCPYTLDRLLAADVLAE
jgi:hypothetical protein